MKITFIIPEQSHILDIAGPLQLFQEAKSLGANLTIDFQSTRHQENTTSVSGLVMKADSVSSIPDKEIPDFIFIPGMDLKFIHTIDYKLLSWLQVCSNKGIQLCGICTGAFILAQAGLLDNRICTTHWKYLDRLKEKVPTAKVHKNRFFIQDGNIYTTAGVASGIDLALFLIEKEISPKMSRDVAREAVVFFRRNEGDPQFNSLNQFRNHIDDMVHKVQNLIEDQRYTSLSIQKLAEHVHISDRHLMRIFKDSTGLTINKYKKLVQVEKAGYMLEQGVSKKEISKLIGVSERQLSRLLNN